MEQGKNGYGIAALVLGIVSFMFGWIILGVVTGIVGIVLSCKSKREFGQNSMATAGLVLSIIGIVYGVPSTLCVMCTCGTLCSLASI